jgi:hypothetical protein
VWVSGGTLSVTVAATNSVEFTPTETGTRIDFRLEVQLKGLMSLLEVFVKPGIKKQKQETLDALETYIAAHIG